MADHDLLRFVYGADALEEKRSVASWLSIRNDGVKSSGRVYQASSRQ